MTIFRNDAPGLVQDILFAYPARRSFAKKLIAVLIGALFLCGAGHWVFFFQGGNIGLSNEDWQKEFAYYAVLRDAVHDRTIPYHLSRPFQLTDRFLAIPETNLSPQILLLPYMSTGTFIMGNILLLYSFGFAGCLLLRRRLGLSLLSFGVLFALFNFNGHITSHFATGHSMWGGYFLLPFFFLALSDVIRRRTSFQPAAGAALVLFAIFLQGSFHMYVWCLMFVIIFSLFEREYLKQGAFIVLGSLVLSSFRLLPSAYAFWGHKQSFVSGYPTLATLVESIVILHNPSRSIQTAFTSVGWWEFDLYTGLIGLTFLCYFGIYKEFGPTRSSSGIPFRRFWAPVLFLFFFSLNNIFMLITNTPLPLVNAERVSSRFIILPFLVLLVSACVHFQEFLGDGTKKIHAKILALAAAIVLCLELVDHSMMWCTANFERYCSTRYPSLDVMLVQRQDAVYQHIVQVSLGISLAALLIAAYVFLSRPKTVHGTVR